MGREGMDITINVYGFGSAFHNQSKYSDIDLILLYDDFRSDNQIRFTILCANLIKEKLNNTDIVMLSLKEENEKNFLKISKAMTTLKELLIVGLET